MNRVALLACLVLAGCPKASTPEPASSASAIPAPIHSPPMANSKPLSVRGDVPGVMTLEQFQTKYAHRKIEEVPVPNDASQGKSFRLLEPNGDLIEFAGRPADTSYTFYDGTLESIMMFCKNSDDATAFRSHIVAEFGPPSKTDTDGTAYWSDETARFTADSQTVSLTHLELRKKHNQAKTNRGS